MFLVSVLALAGVGVSLAGFYDDIYVYGNVSTATVTFEVLNYSGTWVYKVYGWDVEPDEPTDLFPGCIAAFVPDEEILIVRGFNQPTAAMLDDWLMGDGTWMGPVAYAEAYDASPGDDVKDVGMYWWQVFPCVDFTADIIVHYTGCIPAKVAISPLNWLDGPGYFDFSEYTTITYLKLGDMGETIPVLPPVQMHYCELLWIQVTIHLPQINDLQGLIGGFTFTVHAQQWNELCEPVDLPPVVDIYNAEPLPNLSALVDTWRISVSISDDYGIVSYGWLWEYDGGTEGASGTVDPPQTYMDFDQDFDLLPGTNIITFFAYDTAGQYGEDSIVITVV